MPTLPTTIGRYQILSLLGQGGMSTVYLAHDPRFHRDVAVKILSRETMDDAGFRARFETEARTIASLEHPAIVPVYDFGEADGQPYLVMRHIAGGSLAERLQSGPQPLAEVLRIFNRIAPALDLAHARGIVHRDLKPANILFDGISEPYVADFGIAKLSVSDNQFTSTGVVVGTPAYMSPEQIRAERGVAIDGRSDVYALGAMLFNMMTGRAPYEADSPSGVMMKHLMEPPPSLRSMRNDLPAALQQVLETAMAKQRESRYATASQMTAALALATRAPAPGNTAHDQGMGRAPSPSRRNPLIGGLVVAASLAVGVGLLGVLANRTPATSRDATPPATLPATVVAAVTDAPTRQPATPLPVVVATSTIPAPTAAPATPTLPAATATRLPPTVNPLASTPTLTPNADTSNWFFSPHPNAELRNYRNVQVAFRTHANGLELRIDGLSYFLLDDDTVSTEESARQRLGALQNERSGPSCVGEALVNGVVTTFVRGPAGGNIIAWQPRAPNGLLVNVWRRLNGVTIGGCKPA